MTREPTAPRASPNASRRVVSPQLVGRDVELGLLLDAVAHPPAVAVIEGEAGIGKSRLVGELAARLQRGGRRSGAAVPQKASPQQASPTCRVLVGRCHRVREPFPLGPVLEAVRGLGDALGRLDLSPLAGALRSLLPELAAHLPPALEPLGDAAGERHRVFRALVEVLGAVGPVVLVLEDLHFASDDQTVEFLGFLIDDQPENLTVVLTFRGEEVAEELRTIVARPPSSTMSVRVELSPLDEADTRVLASALLDAETKSVSESFAAYLCERTEGVPFAVEEVVALLRERNLLSRHGDKWERRSLADLGVPKAVRDSVRERVGRLSPQARTLIEAASVLEVGSPDVVALAVADLPGSISGARAVAEAVQAGILTEQDGAIGFRHVLATQAIYDSLPAVRRRELHSRAADALAARAGCPIGQLVHHLRQTERLTEWATAAEEAADQAVELGHDEEAVRLLEDVLRTVTLPGEQRGRLAVKLGQAALEMLRSADVVDVLSQSLDHELSAPVRGELALRLALALDQTGQDPARQRVLFAQAVEDLRDRPDLRAHAMVALAIPRVVGVSQTECREWLDRALTIIPEITDPAFRVFILGKVTMILVSIGAREWRPLAERIEEWTGGAPRHAREVNAYLSVGLDACYLGHLSIAHRLLCPALAGAISCGSGRYELVARSTLALCQFRRGSWQEAADGIEDLLSSLEAWPQARIDVEAVAGGLAIAHGDTITGRRRLASAVAEAERLRALDVLALPAGGLARLDLILGELDSAVTTVTRCLNLLEREGEWASTPPIIPSAVEALSRAGEVSAARSLLDRCVREFADLDAPLAPAALEHARGVLGCHSLAASAQQWAAAAEHLLAAAEGYDELPCPYEAAQAREQAALAMFEVGEARAEETLRAALAAFTALGASWDVARCTQAGREHGVNLPVPHRGGRKGYGDALSPREARVARLAARGLTDKQIAAELFLSPKTVSKHLGGAMRKLGVHRRAAVAACLPAGGIEDSPNDVLPEP